MAMEKGGVDGSVGDGDVCDWGEGFIFVVVVDFEGSQGAVACEDAFV